MDLFTQGQPVPTYESNVPYVLRFMIDTKVRQTIPYSVKTLLHCAGTGCGHELDRDSFKKIQAHRKQSQKIKLPN